MNGKKKRHKACFSRFASFCPIAPKFSGSIAEVHKFLLPTEISTRNPQMRYFPKKCEIQVFQIWAYLGSSYGNSRFRRIGVRTGIDLLESDQKHQCAPSGNFFSRKSIISTNVEKNRKFSINWWCPKFSICPQPQVKGQWGNHVRARYEPSLPTTP